MVALIGFTAMAGIIGGGGLVLLHTNKAFNETQVTYDDRNNCDRGDCISISMDWGFYHQSIR